MGETFTLSEGYEIDISAVIKKYGRRKTLSVPSRIIGSQHVEIDSATLLRADTSKIVWIADIDYKKCNKTHVIDGNHKLLKAMVLRENVNVIYLSSEEVAPFIVDP